MMMIRYEKKERVAKGTRLRFSCIHGDYFSMINYIAILSCHLFPIGAIQKWRYICRHCILLKLVCRYENTNKSDMSNLSNYGC